MRIKKLQKNITNPVLISNIENLQYLTGRFFLDESFLLVLPIRIYESKTNLRIPTNKKKPQAVLFGGYLEQVSGIKTDHLKNIGRYIKRGSTLGVEGGLTLAESKYIRNAGKIKLQIVPSPVKQLRLIKDASELKEMQKAYAITIKVFDQVKKALKEKPWSEIELARFMKLAGLQLGADDISFPTIVAAGKNSAIPHHKPSSKIIKKGEPIVLDFGFKVNGYCSDFTRTVFIKSVPAKLRSMYQACEEAYQASIAAIHAGVKAKDVDAAARSVLKRHKLERYFIHSLGHGTGLAVHEQPGLHPRSTDTLQNGMVFSIEPGVYIAKYGGIRIEDLVYLKGGKPHYFAKASTNLENNITK